jgi:hypothetical protein
MGLEHKGRYKWDPLAGLLTVVLKSSKFFLIIASLSIVLWQCFDVTKTYLSQPVSTELQVLPLNDIPDIHISICKSFEVTDCKFASPILGCSEQQVPPSFDQNANNSDFWSTAANLQNLTSHKFRDWMDYIQVWNEASVRWDVIFDSSTFSPEEEEALFTKKMYPYVENLTLLCYTFRDDIRTMSTMVKFQRRGE